MSARGIAAEKITSSFSGRGRGLFFRKCAANLDGGRCCECVAIWPANARQTEFGFVPTLVGKSRQCADHFSGRNKVGHGKHGKIQAGNWSISGWARYRGAALLF